tara:strand:+ start:8028 stop:8918 length:891 start_codon:yes stop_codon:yes gene_type:complete
MTEETKNDNLSQESPDLDNESVVNQTMEAGDNGGLDFFAELDNQVNGAILTQNENTDIVNSEVTSQSPQITGNQISEKQEHNWEKRYSDSSKEAKRLNNRVNELEPYAPILEALKNDPNLIAHVKGYYNRNNNKTPASITKELNLGEDFVFDPEEAIKEPTSDSAKVFGASVDKIVQARIAQTMQQQSAKQTKATRETQFKKDNNISDEEFSDMMSWAQKNKLSLEDIHYLKNRRNKEQNIRKETQEDIVNQQKRMSNTPTSLANVGSEKVERTEDDKVFSAIKNIDSDFDNIFGG